MSFFYIILIAIALAIDAFSVSVIAGLFNKNPDFRYYFRISFHFGMFQFLMPIIGYFLGFYLQELLQSIDHWIAFGLLLIIGVKMIMDSFSKEENKKRKDPSKGYTLILLSIATSIDALAIGITLGVLNQDIFFPSVIIGLICLVFSIAGIFIGKTFGKYFKRVEIFGGIILIAIGTKILIEHIVPT